MLQKQQQHKKLSQRMDIGRKAMSQKVRGKQQIFTIKMDLHW